MKVLALVFCVLFSFTLGVDIHKEYAKGHELFMAGKLSEAEAQWTKMIQWVPQLEVVRFV